jgi:hypothetical protein
MNSPALSPPEDLGVEGLLGDELAAADLALANIDPVLRHLLNADDRAPFSDRIVAQVRAQIEDLARQLAHALENALGGGEGRGRASGTLPLAAALIASRPILAHAHALAVEAQLAERFATQLSLDPVVSPRLQAAMASPIPTTAATAIDLLTAQARFFQEQRRGELPLSELPSEVLHAALLILREHAAGDPARERATAMLDGAIRNNFDEAASRLGLLQRLVSETEGGAIAVLDICDAGVALFVTALGLFAGFERVLATLLTTEAQRARFVLALLASGADPAFVERQFFVLHPEATLPEWFATLRADDAAALLAGTSGSGG